MIKAKNYMNECTVRDLVLIYFERPAFMSRTHICSKMKPKVFSCTDNASGVSPIRCILPFVYQAWRLTLQQQGWFRGCCCQIFILLIIYY